MAIIRTLTDPTEMARYLVAAVLGLAVYVVTALASSAIPVANPPDYGGVLPNLVTVLGFLLVPASIFPSIIGSMFPRFWNATPVTLLNLAPLRRVLLLLTGGVTYALVAFLAAPLLATRQQWLVVPVLSVAVMFGTVMTAQLVGFSLAMLDPDQLSKYLHGVAARERDKEKARQAFNDLCRMVRGLSEAERPTAAEHAITLLGGIGTLRPSLLGADERGLAARVLTECRTAWTGTSGSPARSRAHAAVDVAWHALDLKTENIKVSREPRASSVSGRQVNDRGQRVTFSDAD
jgi:hypothetical protein